MSEKLLQEKSEWLKSKRRFRLTDKGSKHHLGHFVLRNEDMVCEVLHEFDEGNGLTANDICFYYNATAPPILTLQQAGYDCIDGLATCVAKDYVTVV